MSVSPFEPAVPSFMGADEAIRDVRCALDPLLRTDIPRMPPPTTAKMAGIGDFLKLLGVASRQSHGDGAPKRRRLARRVQIPQA
jgi:hypothetical protein